jgi:hypothetical protein
VSARATVPWRSPGHLSLFLPLSAQATGAARDALGAGELTTLQQVDTLHCLRAFVIDEEPDLDPRRPPFPPRLVLDAVFDGPADAFVRDLLRAARSWLPTALRCCQGFPSSGDDGALGAWLLQHARRANTLHLGLVRHDLATIREEDRLYVALRTRADAALAKTEWKGLTPEQIYEALRAWAAEQPDLPKGPRPGLSLGQWVLQALDLVKLLATFVMPAAAVALVAAFVFVAVGLAERLEADITTTPDPAKVARLLDREDEGPQNQFTMLAPVRDSLFRRLNLALSLFLSNQLSRHLWNRGKLVNVETIHFARIHQLDEGRRMLFMSDFDGGWDRYLFDFLGPGAFAVLPNWTNLHGCPKSRFILWPPPDFEQKFLPFTRARQLETTIWYSAVGHLTVTELKRNAALRDGLFGQRTARDAREWLALL